MVVVVIEILSRGLFVSRLTADTPHSRQKPRRNDFGTSLRSNGRASDAPRDRPGLAPAYLTAFLNRAGLQFEVSGGVALIFPASAVAVLAGLFLRWWGVGAVFVGFLLTPWGLSTTPGRAVFFAMAATLQAAIPTLVVRWLRSKQYRCFQFLGVIAVLPTLVSALVALPALILLNRPQLSVGQAFVSFSSWFLGDLVAVLLLAVPLVLIVRPDLVLNEDSVRLYRGWIGSPAAVAKPMGSRPVYSGIRSF